MLRPLVYVLILTAALPAHAANERAMKSLRHWQAVQYRPHYYQGTAPLPGSYWPRSPQPSGAPNLYSAAVSANFERTRISVPAYVTPSYLVKRLSGG